MPNHAVLVGINHYLDPENELRGCVNDCHNLWRLLTYQLNWADQNIEVLRDQDATAKNIRNAVLAMIGVAKPGDNLLWSMSCHGSNIPDPSQKDGLQELLCCHDTKEKNGTWDLKTVITAKWIGQAIAQLHPEATLNIIIDACHAPEGSQLKSMGLSYNRARFMRRSIVGTPVKPMDMKLIEAGIPANVCLWSACESHQTSADSFIEGQWQGAFTAAFLKAFKPGRSRSDTIHFARKWLKENHYSQIPHLFGRAPLTQEPFARDK